MNERLNEQTPPTANDGKPIWDLVIADMHARDQQGRAKYGVPLQANNGRDPLIDAYQEALDLCAYVRQAIEERKQAAPEPATFAVGDLVRKNGGDYQIEGTVVAVVKKRSGAIRYVVEADHPAGLLHIFNAGQLEAITS